MCEMFAVSSKEPVIATEILREFYTHSDEHPHGWGLATFRGNSVSLEKESLKATDSAYLRDRLTRNVEGKNIFGHIRKATMGNLEYANCHPFVWDDASGRTWTLMHNGTLFEPDMIVPYTKYQEGTTDSEGILMVVIDRINKATEAKGAPLNAEERFAVIDEIVLEITKHNKVNLLIYDGEQTYVHTNYKASLHVWQQDNTAMFATKPIRYSGPWEPLPMMQLMAYQNGEKVYEGTTHENEYFDEDHDLTMYYHAYSNL